MESLQGLNWQNNQTWSLLEDNNLDVRGNGYAISIVLDLLFAFLYRLSQILTVSTLLPLVDFWINPNSTSIGSSSRISNDNDVSAKKLLI